MFNLKRFPLSLPLSLSALTIAGFRSTFNPVRCTSTSTGSIFKEANPNAPRNSPYPLVFIHVPQNWHSSSKWQSIQPLLLEKGFDCLEIFCNEHTGKTSREVLKKMADDVQQRIKLASIPFPPVLFAEGLGTLIAETHVSDYPVSGLILISPPSIDNGKSPKEDVLPSPVEEFNYESFPRIALMESLSNVDNIEKHRLANGNSEADIIVFNGEFGQQQSLYEIERWLDDKGF